MNQINPLLQLTSDHLTVPYGPRSHAPQDAPPPVSTLPVCFYCDPPARHPPERCPNVRAIDYYPSGTLRRVELVR